MEIEYFVMKEHQSFDSATVWDQDFPMPKFYNDAIAYLDDNQVPQLIPAYSYDSSTIDVEESMLASWKSNVSFAQPPQAAYSLNSVQHFQSPDRSPNQRLIPGELYKKRRHTLREDAAPIVQQKKLKVDSGYTEEETWPPLYKQFGFLLQDNVEYGTNAGNIQSPDPSTSSTDNSDSQDTSEESDDDSESPIILKKPSTCQNKRDIKLQRQSKIIDDAVDGSCINLMKTHNTRERSDEQHHFGMVVADALRKLPVKEQMEMQAQIMKLLNDTYKICNENQ